ncbi:hypothetical protein R1flu_029136 [Riccia fluitans]|uniref:Uncharacterized protein n=1 Tax=Riccia fluitans TaxID=41844 RepID=A0ABD1XPB6_9MARC
MWNRRRPGGRVSKTLSQFLREANPNPEGKKTVRVQINAQQLMNKREFLQAKSFILYTVDISPLREAVAVWAETILHQEMGIQVNRVRVLNKNCYLITVGKEEDKNWILQANPHADHDVLDFVLTFWGTQKLSWKQRTGVIKLIPKEGDRQAQKLAATHSPQYWI